MASSVEERLILVDFLLGYINVRVIEGHMSVISVVHQLPFQHKLDCLHSQETIELIMVDIP